MGPWRHSSFRGTDRSAHGHYRGHAGGTEPGLSPGFADNGQRSPTEFALGRPAGRLPFVKAPLLAATTLLAALAWSAALLVDAGPWQSAPVFLIAVGLLIMATVSTVGMIVVGGRWAHRLGLATLAITLVPAALRDTDLVWFIGVASTAVALVALLSPALTRSIRRLPSAGGPPPGAITPAMLLLAAPAVFGLIGNHAPPWALLTVGLTAPNAALLYSRVLPGGLLAIRLVWPALAMALSPVLGMPVGVASALAGVLVAVLAWDRSVKTSYHPPREVGTTFPIPPELAPPEVLDAAEVDEKGRRR